VLLEVAAGAGSFSVDPVEFQEVVAEGEEVNEL